MRVLVVGAGSVGSVLAKLLARRGCRVTVATNDAASARTFLGAGSGVRVVAADASKPASVARAAKGADLIVNAAHSAFNLSIMRAALATGADYLDLDSRLVDWKHAEQLRYARRFEKAGRVGLMNAGVSPGLTNLLAAEAASKFEGAVSLRFRVLEEQDASRLIPTWSPSVLKDELASWPLVYRKGRHGFTRPFRDRETFRFPAPYGKQRVVSVYGDEIATVPLFLDVRDADYKAGGKDVEMALAGAHADAKVPTPEEMRRLVRTGVIRDARLIVSVAASGRSEVRGQKSEVTTHAVFPDIRSIMRKASGATYIGYPTALCAAAFVGILPRLRAEGVFPPETLPADLRAAVLSRLRKDGVKFATIKE